MRGWSSSSSAKPGAGARRFGAPVGQRRRVWPAREHQFRVSYRLDNQPVTAADQNERLSRALTALYGLELGDGIGEIMIGRQDQAFDMIKKDELPAEP